MLINARYLISLLMWHCGWTSVQVLSAKLNLYFNKIKRARERERQRKRNWTNLLIELIFQTKYTYQKESYICFI